MKQLLAETEGIRLVLKSKDEVICAKETQLEQARTESELISANLKRAKQDLAKEMSQCKTLEMKINQSGESDPELEGLKQQHREHMDTIQTLWKEQEERREEHEAHMLKLEPQQQQINRTKLGYADEREVLVDNLEEIFYLYTGREKPVSLKILLK